MATNYFPASSNFCHLLITFENSLDPNQDQQNDLDLNSLILFLKDFLNERSQQSTTKSRRSMQHVKIYI